MTKANKTLREEAMTGNITSVMEKVAKAESVEPQFIRSGLERGTIAIPCNTRHESLNPVGIGQGLKTKVNANIGASANLPGTDKELEKLRVSLDAGAHAVMDLTTGSTCDINRTRLAIIKESTVPVGTVPIYQAGIEALDRHGAIVNLRADDLFEVILRQAQDGVDFMTVHCGVTMATIDRLVKEKRVTDIVSRGGAFLTAWILHNQEENPLFRQYDRLLEIARDYDVTLSLGDGLRPGCLADATDRAQVQELVILGELVQRAWDAGVQVMVEGPGHVPMNQIEANVILEKRLCHGAPFYVLGPLVTDIAAGYDHITGAIGGAIAAAAGADFLCYVTPAEHLGLPDSQDVRDGIMASRIAAHAADLVKKVKGAWEQDLSMARARKALDWEKQISLCLDPDKAARYRKERNPEEIEGCTMCGDYCAMKIVAEYLGKDRDKQ